MRETAIQQRICKYLERRGAWVTKIHGSAMQPRVIDLLVCYRGQFIGLEVKVPGEEATPMQRRVLHEIQQAGGVTAVVTSVKDVTWLLDVTLKE